MPAGGLEIEFQDRIIRISAGQELTEIANNLFDDNLNGIIDENNGSLIGEGVNAVQRYLYENLKCVDYFTGAGNDNIMIDEKRDDGIDNDKNWNPMTDDVGLDGVPKTGDYGETGSWTAICPANPTSTRPTSTSPT
jgi:hypothetical protein